MRYLRRLVSRRAARWADGRFVAEGPKLLAEAILAHARIEAVFVDPEIGSASHMELADQAAATGARLHTVEPGVLARVGDAVTPQPVAAIVDMVHVPFGALDLSGLTVVLAGLQDPGNAGTIVRSATAAGCVAVVFSEGAVDIYNPKTVRATAGALFHVPLAVVPDVTTVLDHLAASGIPRIASVARGGGAHDERDWTGPAALVLGSEAHGLGAELHDRVDGFVTIPMHDAAESLNVAMAATVLCFEAARQRRQAAHGVGSRS
ncbi:MAG TPA: RNA methyltransferase [Acidimicrobiales bacterium]|nr:RNA methyltransferase [Acidimicrobiales bacterium]